MGRSRPDKVFPETGERKIRAFGCAMFFLPRDPGVPPGQNVQTQTRKERQSSSSVKDQVQLHTTEPRDSLTILTHNYRVPHGKQSVPNNYEDD